MSNRLFCYIDKDKLFMQTFTWKEWQSFLFVVESDMSKWEKMVLRLQEDDNHELCPRATFLMVFTLFIGL